jgi:hypothetical protein
MNQTKRLEVLEAFASSKPTEFDGFARAYLEAHPEPVVESLVSLPATPTDREVPNEFSVFIAQEEKPKRTRKTKVVDPEIIEVPEE